MGRVWVKITDFLRVGVRRRGRGGRTFLILIINVSGPAFWGLINPEWSLCNKGRRQSPVNLEPNTLLYDPNLRQLHIDKHRVSVCKCGLCASRIWEKASTWRNVLEGWRSVLTSSFKILFYNLLKLHPVFLKHMPICKLLIIICFINHYPKMTATKLQKRKVLRRLLRIILKGYLPNPFIQSFLECNIDNCWKLWN